jgi:hypothetical protein
MHAFEWTKSELALSSSFLRIGVDEVASTALGVYTGMCVGETA